MSTEEQELVEEQENNQQTGENPDVISEGTEQSDVKASPKSEKKKTKAQLEFELLQSDYEKMQNYAVRTKADLENIKKRNENISRERYQDGKLEAVIDMLPVLDSITRAMELEMPDTAREGINMIKKQFDTIFMKMGVTEILAEGLPFDPNYHNALMQVDNPAQSGLCVQIYEKGYKYHDRVIRHSSVVVAK